MLCSQSVLPVPLYLSGVFSQNPRLLHPSFSVIRSFLLFRPKNHDDQTGILLTFKNAVEPMTNPLDFSDGDEAIQRGQQSLVGPVSPFTGGKKSVLFKFLGVRNEDIENLVYFAVKSQEETIRTTQQLQNGDGPFAELPRIKKSIDLMGLNMMDVNGSLTQFDYAKNANEEAIRSTHSQRRGPVPSSRFNFSVPKKQKSNRGKATNITGFSKIKKFGNSIPEGLKPRFSDHEKVRHKKSVVFKFLGVRDEEIENFLYFAKKTHEEAIRKRGKALISTYTTDFSKKFGNSVLKDLKPAEKVGHNRKHLKRCGESIKTEEKNKPKRQKDGKIQNKKGLARLAEWNLEPPPKMPIDLKKLIEEMGGSQEKLLIQKIIFKTELNKTHNRLQIPMNQVMVTDFLTQDKARKLDREGLNVDLIEPCLKKSKIHLTKWSMGNSKVFVFNEQWKSVMDGNRTLKKNAVMQIWSPRTAPESKLCFARVKVRDGDDD
ncbi:hypothetical protein SLEP1_g27484 [Rubroshorea leprosula]|uniref:B3 domain-containing protein n=1 Tax=Rubroshorea leprosula TaxID=152421 RepID=A0AAV5K370_9ROSI|nr:hypothetical protein SLEP1_g27484 [Rubroshorea leprosula]